MRCEIGAGVTLVTERERVAREVSDVELVSALADSVYGDCGVPCEAVSASPSASVVPKSIHIHNHIRIQIPDGVNSIKLKKRPKRPEGRHKRAFAPVPPGAGPPDAGQTVTCLRVRVRAVGQSSESDLMGTRADGVLQRRV